MENDENNEYRFKLIGLVRKNSLLWNREHKFCCNRLLKLKAWNAIGECLGKSPYQVRRNWQSLRDQYRRDLKRQLTQNIEPTWIFFNDMSFIRKFLRIQDVNKCGSDSESDTELNKDRNENRLQLEQSHETINVTTGSDLMTQLLSAESTFEEQSETNKLNDGPLCDSSAQGELDSCSIKLEVYSEKDDASEKSDNEMRSVEKTLNQLFTLAAPNQKTNTNGLTTSTPTSIGTPPKKRSHADEVTCDVLENNKGTRYRNQTITAHFPTSMITEIPSKRRLLEGADCSTNASYELSSAKEMKNAKAIAPIKQKINIIASESITKDHHANDHHFERRNHSQPKVSTTADFEKQSHPKDSSEAAQAQQCQLNRLPAENEIDDTDEDNLAASFNTKRLAETQANDANNLCPSTNRCSASIPAVEYANITNRTKENVAVVREDDDYHFVISLLPFLRRTNLDQKLKTRMDIMKVIMESLR